MTERVGFTADDLLRIEQAIASGRLRVRFADREVWYQSVVDLLKAREVMLKQLGKSRIRPVVATYDKGLSR